MRGLLAAASGAALGALVSLRTIVAFTDMPWFDVDPSLDPSPFAGLGPSGSLWIDACIAALSAVLVGVFAGRAAVLVAVGIRSRCDRMARPRLDERVVRVRRRDSRGAQPAADGAARLEFDGGGPAGGLLPVARARRMAMVP